MRTSLFVFAIWGCLLLDAGASAMEAECGQLNDVTATFEMEVNSELNNNGEYKKNQNCKYKFKVPAGVAVKWDVSKFDLEQQNNCNSGDYVELRTTYGVNERYCSMLSPFHFDFEARDAVWGFQIRFKTDGSVQETGFESVVTTDVDEPGPFSQTDCGRDLGSSRIVGGEEVTPFTIPWQVGLTNNVNKEYYSCGGTLISHRDVLTAAHCIGNLNNDLYVGYADHDASEKGDGKFAKVKSIKVHPNYNSQKYDYDFALLRLEKALVMDDRVNYACLPEDTNEDYSGRRLTASGWGTLKYGFFQPTSDVLMSVEVKCITNQECKQTEYDAGEITDRMMCAGDVDEGGVDSCQGDSGGPLTDYDMDTMRTTVVGVVSWGFKCAREGYPGVYSRVTSVKDWINNNTIPVQVPAK